MILKAMLLLAVLACGAGMTRFAPPEPAKKPPEPAENAGIAVVELFSSEGCSSCPPADALLGKLSGEEKDEGRRVFFLAFHVDYWDYLGWKDRFASKAFSDRQRTAAAQLAKTGGKGGVYTPQMVVNGTEGFVGSDEGAARAAIARALKQPATAKVVPTIGARKAGEAIRVSATITSLEDFAGRGKLDRETTLCVALIESGLSTEVKRGENSGTTLTHDRVVRAFGTKKIQDGKAEIELKCPEGVKEDHCRIVAYVQDAATLRVNGAAEVALTAPPAPTTPEPPKPSNPGVPAQGPKSAPK